MRKTVKKKIIELLDAIMDAHVEIDKTFKINDVETMRVILAECQECAIIAGNTIEQFDGKHANVITMLECYCDYLYQVYENNIKDAMIKIQMDDMISAIREAVLREIPTELKVVFMPYKASMWTSLESVWRAASADPGCEVKVVAIPYYTLDNQRKPVKLVYEADLFPQDVPITHFNDYDIAKELPDMIFIHNPYDDRNTVTRVPEQYYSYILKQFTECLVYSPYGMMSYYDPDKGFFMCQTNGVLVSHKIILQSEKVKQIYMKHGISEDKIIALGSPKIDAIVESIKKPCVYPMGWEDKLKGRKVFLLNTHLSYFVRGYIYSQSEAGNIDFAQTTHEIIFDRLLNKDDCALIWRPHPLLKDTLRSRNCLEALAFVEGLEKRIEASTNAVLDTNGEYDTSFNISDALISTYSSVVSEYMISGKPVFIYRKRRDEHKCKNSPVSYWNNYYSDSMDDMSKFRDFVEMVMQEEDYLKEQRMNDVKEAFEYLDGTIGEKIYSCLKAEWEL